MHMNFSKLSSRGIERLARTIHPGDWAIGQLSRIAHWLVIGNKPLSSILADSAEERESLSSLLKS